MSEHSILPGRMPEHQQRRLDELISRSKAGTLTESKRLELQQTLDPADDMTIELL